MDLQPGPSTATSTTTIIAQSAPVDNGLRPMPPLQRMVHTAQWVFHEWVLGYEEMQVINIYATIALPCQVTAP